MLDRFGIFGKMDMYDVAPDRTFSDYNDLFDDEVEVGTDGELVWLPARPEPDHSMSFWDGFDAEGMDIERSIGRLTESPSTFFTAWRPLWWTERLSDIPVSLPSLDDLINLRMRCDEFARVITDIRDAEFGGSAAIMAFDTGIGADDLALYLEGFKLPRNLGEVERLAASLGIEPSALIYAWIFSATRGFEGLSAGRGIRSGYFLRAKAMAQAAAFLIGERGPEFDLSPHAGDGPELVFSELLDLLQLSLRAGFDEELVYGVFADCASYYPAVLDSIYAEPHKVIVNFGMGDPNRNRSIIRLMAKRLANDGRIEDAVMMERKGESILADMEQGGARPDVPVQTDFHWMDEILVGLGKGSDEEVFTAQNMERIFSRVYDGGRGMAEGDMRLLGSLVLAYGNSMPLSSRMSFYHLLEIERERGMDSAKAEATGSPSVAEIKGVMRDNTEGSPEGAALDLLMNEATARLGSVVPEVEGQMGLRDAARLAHIAIISGVDPERGYSTVAAYLGKRGERFDAMGAMRLADAYARGGLNDWGSHVLRLAIICAEETGNHLDAAIMNCCAADGLSALVGKGTNPSDVLERDVSVREYLAGQRRHFYERGRRLTKIKVPKGARDLRDRFRDEAELGIRAMKREQPRHGAMGVDPSTGEEAWFAHGNVEETFRRVPPVDRRMIRHVPRWAPMNLGASAFGMTTGVFTTTGTAARPLIR